MGTIHLMAQTHSRDRRCNPIYEEEAVFHGVYVVPINGIDTKRDGLITKAEDAEIGVLVLGASTESSGPGPLITQLIKAMHLLRVPVTVVPGNLSKEQLETIT